MAELVERPRHLSTGLPRPFGVGPHPWKTERVSTGQPRFLKLTDVAEVLNVTTRQVYALVRSGALRGIQVGGRNQWRVEDVELEDYIKRQYAKSDERDSEQAR
jgi:excisionase family DNA binding protein